MISKNRDSSPSRIGMMNVHIFSHLGELHIIFRNFVFSSRFTFCWKKPWIGPFFLKTLFSQSLQLSCDTFCLAFSLLDRTIGALKIRKRLIRLLAITCLKIAIKFTEDDKRDNLNRQLCEVSSNQRVSVVTLTITQNSYKNDPFRLVDTNFQNAMWIEWNFLFWRSSNGILWIAPHVTYCTVLSIYFPMEKIFFQIIKENRLHHFCHANWSGKITW